jgi:proline iminopeptidase
MALGIQEWIIMGTPLEVFYKWGFFLRNPRSVKGIIMINCTLNLELSYETSWCPKVCKLLDVKDSSYFIDETIPLPTRWDSLIHALNKKDLMWKMGFSNRDDMMKIGQTYGDIPNWNWEFQ